MKFYLGKNQQEVRIEITPTITETLDLTLDTLNVVLEANDRAEPYEPNTPFRIEFSIDESAEFVISADRVSVFSYEPLRYKHELSLEQNTRFLVHHLNRNTVISQPANNRKGFYGQNIILGEADNSTPVRADLVINDDVGLVSNALTFIELTPREKLTKAFVKIDVWVTISNPEEADKKATLYKVKNIDELRTLVGDSNIYTNDIACIVPDETYGALDTILSDVNKNDFENEQESAILKERVIDYGERKIGVAIELETRTQSARYRNPSQFINATFTPETEKSITCIIVNVRTRFETYYYNCYEAIELILDRYKQQYNGTSKETLFELPDGGELHDLLVNTVAPNITLTQSNMFDALTDIFNLFDATFKIENGILDIEYFNDRNKTEVPQNGFAGINLQITEEKRVNGLITYYQNAKRSYTYPSNGYSGVRSNILGVPESDSDKQFLLPKPIDIIEGVELYVNTLKIRIKYPSGNTEYQVTNGFGLDITPYVVEQNIWSSLRKDVTVPYNNDSRNVTQVNSLYYSRGDNKINIASTYKYLNQTIYVMENVMQCALARMLGVSKIDQSLDFDVISPKPNDWREMFFKVNYISRLDGRLRIESVNNKYKGEMVVNQSEGSVDLGKLGLNMLGVSLRTGEPKLNATHKITSWNDRIRKGQVLTYDGEEWVANVCQYTIIDENYLKGSITFVKNYNSLSTRIKLNREKRLSNISNELTIKSEDNIIEYCYFSSKKETIDLEEAKVFPTSVITNIMMKTFTTLYPDFKIDLALMNSTVVEKPIAIPLVKYGAGNMICFEMDFDSPISAGNQLEIADGWFGTDKYFSRAIKYTDEEGFLDSVNIYFVNNDVEKNPDYPEYESIGQSAGAITDYLVKKQPNEIFALNYQICFLAKEDKVDFVGSKFIENNCLTQLDNKKEKFYIYYTTHDNNFQYSIIDRKCEGERVDIIDVDFVVLSDGVSIEFTMGQAIENGLKTWAIGDSDGNIYFASNRATTTRTNVVELNFYFKHDRL